MSFFPIEEVRKLLNQLIAYLIWFFDKSYDIAIDDKTCQKKFTFYMFFYDNYTPFKKHTIYTQMYVIKAYFQEIRSLSFIYLELF